MGIEFAKVDTDESIRKWNEGKIAVGLLHPASAGHGLNLQDGGSVMIWFGITWNLEFYQQTVARLWRQGQNNKTVSVIHILTKNTVDERIMMSLSDKDISQSALIDAVKVNMKI